MVSAVVQHTDISTVINTDINMVGTMDMDMDILKRIINQILSLLNLLF